MCCVYEITLDITWWGFICCVLQLATILLITVRSSIIALNNNCVLFCVGYNLKKAHLNIRAGCASSKLCQGRKDANTQKRLHLPTSVKYLATKFQKQEKNQIVSDPQLDFLRIHLSLQNSIRNETNVPDLDQGVIIRTAINWKSNQKTLPNFLRVGWMIVLSPEPVNALGDFAKSIN